MTNVAIVGASGYTGLELIKILINHPQFNITYLSTSTGEESLVNLHPSLQDVFNCDVSKANAKDIAKVSKLAFLALPHKTAMSFAKELISLGVKVVDLSADYRLELQNYEKFYCPHEDKDNLPNAVYGLPEIYRNEIKNCNLIANPGCYPTATMLALLPFVKYINEKYPVIIDAKSGVSGAGKSLKQTTHFVNVNENIFAYAPIEHRHSIEIKEKLQKLTNKAFNVNFVPHLLPLTRGMLVSSYITLNENIDALKTLQEFYKNEKFVRIRTTPVDIKLNAGTNFCDIYVKQNENTLFISSSIDNLLRGASSQAVVNANLMMGFSEDLGIPNVAYVP